MLEPPVEQVALSSTDKESHINPENLAPPSLASKSTPKISSSLPNFSSPVFDNQINEIDTELNMFDQPAPLLKNVIIPFDLPKPSQGSDILSLSITTTQESTSTTSSRDAITIQDDLAEESSVLSPNRPKTRKWKRLARNKNQEKQSNCIMLKGVHGKQPLDENVDQPKLPR